MYLLEDQKTYPAPAEWLFSACMTVLFTLVHGYQFNCGDQAEHLPQVYRLFTPSLYPGDFFLSLYDQTFTVREYWVWMVYGVAKITGVSHACFFLHHTCVFFTMLAWLRVTAILTGSMVAGLITPLLLVFLNSFTVGGNTLLGPAFIGSIPAEALASCGVWAYFSGHKRTGAGLIGLATLFQALVGLQWLLLLCALEVLAGVSARAIRNAAAMALVYLIMASPMLVPVLQRQLAPQSFAYDRELYYRILYVYRNVLHYIPSYFPAADYTKLLILMAAAGVLYRYIPKGERKTNLLLLAALIISGCLLYYALLETFHISAIGKLQWFKTTVWLNVLCCMAIAGALARYAHRPALLFTRKGLKWVMAGCAVAGFILVLNPSILPGKFAYRYQAGNHPATDRQKIHEWISVNTPEEAIFLAPPDDDAFSCEARRPMPVNYKAIVHEPFFLMQWYDRMKTYYHMNFEEVGNNSALHIAQRNYETILSYPQPNLATYRLDNLATCRFPGRLGKPVHREGNWIVTAIE